MFITCSSIHHTALLVGDSHGGNEQISCRNVRCAKYDSQCMKIIMKLSKNCVCVAAFPTAAVLQGAV